MFSNIHVDLLKYSISFILTIYVIKWIFNYIDLDRNDCLETTKYQNVDISNIKQSIILFYKFIKLHPEMFDNTVGYKFVEYDDNIFPIYDSDMKFYDSIHNVNGIISCAYNKIDDKIDFQFHIKIENSLHSLDKCYLSILDKYIRNQSKIGNIVDLNFYKIMNTSLVTHNFYNNDIDQWRDDCKNIEDGYFSNHKQFIFNIMKNKIDYNINTSNSWNNMILEGVPGVGKSSLIYRIALILKRNIISIDLVLYLDKKKELYSIFHGNDFKLPNDDTKVYNSENCIIVLEEFDNTIEKLVELEKLYKLKLKLINNSQKSKELSLNRKINDQAIEIGECDNQINENYLSAQKKLVDDSRNFDNSLHAINNDINNIIQIHKEFHKNDILRLSDLLELFQGPIPVKDRIIIGTTNHFEKIKSYIPELFRNGRMTPVRFDYLEWETFNELCMYYFNNTLSCKPFKITIPTSQLIELAIKIQLTSYDINEFKYEIDTIQNKLNFTEIIKPEQNKQIATEIANQCNNSNVNTAKTEILKKLLNMQ
jgi:hypothetical protein